MRQPDAPPAALQGEQLEQYKKLQKEWNDLHTKMQDQMRELVKAAAAKNEQENERIKKAAEEETAKKAAEEAAKTARARASETEKEDKDAMAVDAEELENLIKRKLEPREGEPAIDLQKIAKEVAQELQAKRRKKEHRED